MYSIVLLTSCGESMDTIILDFTEPPSEIEIQDTLKICANDTVFINVENNIENSIIEWSTGSTDSLEAFFNDGIYSVSISNNCGFEIDSFIIETIPQIENFSIPDNLTICDENSFILESEITQENVEILWNTEETSSSIEVQQDGIYWVESSNSCFQLRDSISIIFEISPVSLNLGTNDTICDGTEILLDGFQGDQFSYEWQDGNNNSLYSVTNTGLYILNTSSECGTTSDTFEIVVLETDEILTSIEDNYLTCEGVPLLIDLTNVIADEILWNDGSNDRIRELLTPSLYSIQFINSCIDTIVDFNFVQEDCTEDKIYIPNTFTPNGDSNNDIFRAFFNENLDIQSYQLVIYNRWGEKVYIGVDPKMGWDGTFKGESLQSGVYAYVLQAEFVDEDGELFEVLRSGDLTILR